MPCRERDFDWKIAPAADAKTAARTPFLRRKNQRIIIFIIKKTTALADVSSHYALKASPAVAFCDFPARESFPALRATLYRAINAPFSTRLGANRTA
jgi:hypothetical protein